MSTKDKWQLIGQFAFGVLFVVIGLFMFTTSELHCNKRTDICSLHRVWLGYHARTTPLFKPSHYPRARFLKTRNDDGSYTYNLAVANGKRSWIIDAFASSDKEPVVANTKKLDRFLRAKTATTFRLKQIPSLLQWLLAIILIGVSLCMIWASLKGEILEGG